MLRRARNIKNYLAPINWQLPSETLAHIVGFLPTERDLVNATMVCQHWRTTLLSFPRLWRNPGGSSSEIQAYLERSKSTPINVTLSSTELAELIVPHTSRLVRLTLQVDDSSCFSQIAKHLYYPIPMLSACRITFGYRVRTMEFPSDIEKPFFLYSKKLELEGVSGFRGLQTFPHVTELGLHTHYHPYPPMPMDSFLSIFEHLPALERVSILFFTDLHIDPIPRMITLPHVQEMSLSKSTADGIGIPISIPHILEFLQLPNLTSLCFRVTEKRRELLFQPVFPVTTFDRHLPNLAALPELQVKFGMSSGEATFRSPSQATLKYFAGPFSSYGGQERIHWRELPLHTVQKLTVNMVFPPSVQELEWFIELLRDLKFLEGLELEGECDRALSRFRHYVSHEAISLRIQTLTVRRGGYTRRQALRLKRSFDAAGLNITFIFIPDPWVREGRTVEADADSSSDEWDENEGEGEGEGDGSGWNGHRQSLFGRVE